MVIFFEENEMEVCRGEGCELGQDACMTPTGALPDEKTMRVSGGMNGGRINIEYNDIRGSNDQSDGDGEMYETLAPQS